MDIFFGCLLPWLFTGGIKAGSLGSMSFISIATSFKSTSFLEFISLLCGTVGFLFYLILPISQIRFGLSENRGFSPRMFADGIPRKFDLGGRLPSGKRLHNYGESPFFIGKSA